MNIPNKILTETKTKKTYKADEPRNVASLKIVGVVDNLTNDGNIYYIAKNDKDYFTVNSSPYAKEVYELLDVTPVKDGYTFVGWMLENGSMFSAFSFNSAASLSI